MFDNLENFGETVVATPPVPATSGVAMVVTGEFLLGAITPPFNVVVAPAGVRPTATNAEILRVTGKSGGGANLTWAIVRAQEGTTARTILVGDAIYLSPTAKTIQDIIDGTLWKSPENATRNVIQPTGPFAGLTYKTSVDQVLQLGGHYPYPAGTQAFWLDERGNIYGGKNLLLAPRPLGNMQQSVPDFYYDQGMQRICVRSGMFIQVDDPPDLTMIRFGPQGGYPYGKLGNADGTYQDLTGVEANVGFFQLAGIPAGVPFNGDITTPGGIAVRSSLIINGFTAERPRDPTGSGQYYVQGSRFRLALTPIGAYNTDYYFQVEENGTVHIGRTAIDSGLKTAQLIVRGDSGRNEKQRIEKANTVSGGTFKILHYAAPAASPKFGGAGVALTGTVAVTNGSAAVVGTGSAFLTQVAIGDRIRIGADAPIYTVLTVPDDTHLTLASNYNGVTASGLAYVRSGQVSGAIAYDASNDTVQTALEAMSTIGTGSNIAGTVAVTNNSNAVVGTGTAFKSDLRVGDYLRFGADSASTLYSVNSIPDDTHLTLAVVYAGGTTSGITARKVSVAVTGGPLPNGLLTMEFTGALRNTLMLPMGIVSSLTGGGSLSIVPTARGRASGGDSLLCRFVHGGQPGSTPTGNYYEWLDPGGLNVVEKLDNLGYKTFTTKSQALVSQTISANTTLVDRSAEVVLTDTTGGAVTITLPATPTAGTRFRFVDAGHTWTTNNLTIARNGKTIDNVAANVVLSVTDSLRELFYDGVGWRTVSTGLPAAGVGGEIAYVQRTSDIGVPATTAATATDLGLTSGAIVYDGTPILIEFFGPRIDRGTNTITIVLYDGATQLGNMGVADGAPSTFGPFRRRLTPTPGSHTYLPKAYVNGGNGAIRAGDGSANNWMPAFFRILKA